jgi:hypothetical protein
MAVNATIIYPYRYDLLLLWEDGIRWLSLITQ